MFVPEKILLENEKFKIISAVLSTISGTLKAQDDQFSKIRDNLSTLIKDYDPSFIYED